MMRYFDCSGKDTSVLHQLTALGYDVIIVNYPEDTLVNGTIIDGGADYMERNAMNMIALIQYVNGRLQQQGNTNQLAIVGPSMGGQITRYALAYMEKMYAQTGNPIWLHHTRLWISIDSPHLGANIPLGAQSLVWQLSDQSPAADSSFKYKLNATAAKQQLIESFSPDYDLSPNPSYLNGRTVSQGYSTNAGSSFFQQFYNNQFNNGLPNSKGYPINLRKIALVNGSLSGKKTAIMLDEYGNRNIVNYGNAGDQSLNLRGFAGINTLVLATEAYNMPAYGSGYNINSRFKWNKGTSGSDISISANNINSRGSMDIIPGGWYNSWDQLNGQISGIRQHGYPGMFSFIPSWFSLVNDILYLLLGGDIRVEQRTNTMVHSFIPSFSALGITTPDQDWSQPLNRNLVCTGETPFNSYFGHDDNTQHTSFDCESVSWLLKELDSIPQKPWYPLTGDDINGSSLLCVGSSGTYSFGSICKIPGNATWDVSPSLQILGSDSISVTVFGSDYADGTITATFPNGYTVTKNITIGRPPVAGFYSSGGWGGNNTYSTLQEDVDGSNEVSYGVVYVNITNPSLVSGGINATWSLVDGNPDYWQWLPNYNQLVFYLEPNNSVIFKMEIPTICGNEQYQFLFYSGSASAYYKISPNPAANSLTVTISDNSATSNKTLNLANIKNNNSTRSQVATMATNTNKTTVSNITKEGKSGIKAIQVFDASGRLCKSLQYPATKQATVDVSNLHNGVYFLSISNGVKTVQKKIIVQH